MLVDATLHLCPATSSILQGLLSLVNGHLQVWGAFLRTEGSPTELSSPALGRLMAQVEIRYRNGCHSSHFVLEVGVILILCFYLCGFPHSTTVRMNVLRHGHQTLMWCGMGSQLLCKLVNGANNVVNGACLLSHFRPIYLGFWHQSNPPKNSNHMFSHVSHRHHS